MVLPGQKAAVSADAQPQAGSNMSAVGAWNSFHLPRRGCKPEKAKKVDDLLHRYMSGFYLSSVPVLLCGVGQVI